VAVGSGDGVADWIAESVPATIVAIASASLVRDGVGTLPAHDGNILSRSNIEATPIRKLFIANPPCF